MLSAFFESLPVAIGIVLATLPLVGVSLLLLDRPEQHAYVAFLAGWIAGAITVCVFAISLSDLSTPEQRPPAVWIVWLRLILGLGLLALAIRKFTHRDKSSNDDPPAWMRALKQMSPFKIFGLGAGMAALNPKNAALFASGALIIASKTYAPSAQIIVMIGFVALSSAGLVLPLALSLVLGARAESPLRLLSAFMERYSALMVAFVLAALGGIVFMNALLDL